ncbi:variable surface protein [Plasmodium gonderi]|uniref:Variable surface protein n=1 Tax=Plasmodium gonderi TaxID=77519 RepID=A0A1Y1JSE7_PLAGO|nr:variable surface protein [Plasmodium gonderi]GAW84368.1 variable surface protein [Plasmodium gonderi]
MKFLDECDEELLLDLPEKLDKHIAKDEITNKTLERVLFNDYPIIHVIPLSRRIAIILYKFTGKKIHKIAVHSIYYTLVIILTHKCNSNLCRKYTELNNVEFLTIVVICLSQILYNIGKFDFLKKYETPEVREKELAKKKKWEIKKKREQNMINNINNKNVRKRLCKKYILYDVLYSLFQLFCIIIIVLDLIKSTVVYETQEIASAAYIPVRIFIEDRRNSQDTKKAFGSILMILDIPKVFLYIYFTFLLSLSFIIMASIIYIMIKVVKYEHLKERKTKMNFIEY